MINEEVGNTQSYLSRIQQWTQISARNSPTVDAISASKYAR